MAPFPFTFFAIFTILYMKEGWTLDVITKAPIETVNSNVGLSDPSLSFSFRVI